VSGAAVVEAGVAGCVWAITADEPKTISNPVTPPKKDRLIFFRGSNFIGAARV
jgi:hypothetical protein